MSIEKDLAKAAASRGAQLRDCGGGHFQIIGDRLVNYYPLSKGSTAYVSGSQRGDKRVSISEAVDMAFSTPVPPVAPAPATPPKSSKGYRRVKFLFRMQNGLCSICAGPMNLVDMNAMTRPERKRFFKDETAIAMAATIEHTIPLSLARGVDNNTRAAHHACNQIKGSELIEPYPLPCYDGTQLPKIKLAPGVYIEMEQVA